MSSCKFSQAYRDPAHLEARQAAKGWTTLDVILQIKANIALMKKEGFLPTDSGCCTDRP